MIIIFITLTLILIFLFIGNFFYNIALNRHYNKEFLINPSNKDKNFENSLDLYYKKERNKLCNWHNKNVSNFTFSTFDNLKLSAYHYNNSSRNYVIVVHGYMGKAEDLTFACKNFFDKGYNVISFDLRGHGHSQGDYIAMGWHDRLDLIRLINLVISKDSNAKIVLYGVSMGAATVMMASGENLPKNVKAIVEDCGYTSIKDIFSYQLKLIFNLPSFPIINFANIITKIRANFSFYSGNCIKQIEKSNTPILFIHGGKDSFVPFDMVKPLYNICPTKKDILVIENAEHGMAAFVAKDKYWNKVFSFLDSCL